MKLTLTIIFACVALAGMAQKKDTSKTNIVASTPVMTTASTFFTSQTQLDTTTCYYQYIVGVLNGDLKTAWAKGFVITHNNGRLYFSGEPVSITYLDENKKRVTQKVINSYH